MNRKIVAFVCLAWIPATLALDAGSGFGRQNLLGLIAWVCLVAFLCREDSLTRLQVAIVVVYATFIEYLFSDYLGAYRYRLHNVPAFVPPGHGLVYLAALAGGRSEWVRARRVWLIGSLLAVGTAYAAWGYFFSPRPDGVGAFWFGCLVLFMVRGRAPLVYASAFVIVTYLELLGTSLGIWTWSRIDPVLGRFTLGNPPSGIAGAYCFLDAAALSVAPWLVGLGVRVRRLHSTTELATDG